ncbi:MAG: hypothetical protein R6V32_04990 [Bacteroidales bacterium]
MLKRIIFFLCAISFIVFIGCNKAEDELVGSSWLLESMMAEDTTEVVWHFKNDHSLVRVCNYINDTIGTVADTAYYSFEDELTFTAIKIIEAKNSECLAFINGFFRIEKISDNLLVITRYKMSDETTGGAYLRREFTRRN